MSNGELAIVFGAIALLIGAAILIGGYYSGQQEAAWTRFADQHGLTCDVRRFLGMIMTLTVSGNYRGRATTLGTFTRHYGRVVIAYTYVETALQSANPVGDLKIAPQGVVSTLRHWLGFNDMLIGDPASDERFFFRSSDESICRRLFASLALRQQRSALRKFDQIEIKKQTVKIQQSGVEKDTDYLKQLFDFVTALADEFERASKAS